MDISENLAEASTLSKEYYLEEGFYQKEKEFLFGDSWQAVGRADLVKNPGDFFTTEIAGEPLVIARGIDGELRALSNVCRHRGSLIVDNSGNSKSLQCPYHAWTYNLKGELMGAPEFEGVANWTKKSACLPQYRVEIWGLYVFVNLGKSKLELKEVMGEIPNDMQKRGYRWEDYQFLARTQYIVECNWKVYIDNYLEGYHLPTVHPNLYKELDYQSYRVDTFEYYSSQYAPLRPVTSATSETRRYDPNSGAKEPLYYWVFPNFLINIYPDNVHLNIILPLGVNKTLTLFDWFSVPGMEGSLEKTIAFSDQVQKEDLLICERVQKGLQSRDYSRGRYSVKRENGVHHFHRLLQKQLGHV